MKSYSFEDSHRDDNNLYVDILAFHSSNTASEERERERKVL